MWTLSLRHTPGPPLSPWPSAQSLPRGPLLSPAHFQGLGRVGRPEAPERMGPPFRNVAPPQGSRQGMCQRGRLQPSLGRALRPIGPGCPQRPSPPGQPAGQELVGQQRGRSHPRGSPRPCAARRGAHRVHEERGQPTASLGQQQGFKCLRICVVFTV